MAFNLDFSGWAAGRDALANSIANSAQMQAQAKLAKTKAWNTAISGLANAALNVYDDYTKAKEEKENNKKQLMAILNSYDFQPEDVDRFGGLAERFGFDVDEIKQMITEKNALNGGF